MKIIFIGIQKLSYQIKNYCFEYLIEMKSFAKIVLIL